ncbi:MAG TPA: class I SAM-dependent methyltransferase [Saprospiraceae bacterium]|nr:class I SAM-dependent methyltransferase [Saprospiraceae bacterium]
MMQKIQIAKRFLSFFWRAKTKYMVHSPFVYDLLEIILDDDRNYYTFEEVEGIREQMLQNRNSIHVTDFGAGSKTTSRNERSIRSIAKSALSPPWQCKILFRIILHLKPKNLLELGTSLGISTLYQSGVSNQVRITTLEGCPEISKIAQHNFNSLKRKNIDLRTGPFSETLPKALADIKQLDYVFIDGHHTESATLEYFQMVLAFLHENSILIFDDIHWSVEMENAWRQIKAHPKVKLTMDFFFFGIVFFRKENKHKEHFSLVPAKWKFWQMGFRA